jgi:hypothetical protein
MQVKVLPESNHCGDSLGDSGLVDGSRLVASVISSTNSLRLYFDRKRKPHRVEVGIVEESGRRFLLDDFSFLMHFGRSLQNHGHEPALHVGGTGTRCVELWIENRTRGSTLRVKVACKCLLVYGYRGRASRMNISSKTAEIRHSTALPPNSSSEPDQQQR